MTVAESSIYPSEELIEQDIRVAGRVSSLALEYDRWSALLRAQPPQVQSFIEHQAQILTGAIIQGLSRVHFSLPDQVIVDGFQGIPDKVSLAIGGGFRRQNVGSRLLRFSRKDIQTAIRSRLDELEAGANPAAAAGAGLIRYATAVYLVHQWLPTHRADNYQTRSSADLDGFMAQWLILNDQDQLFVDSLAEADELLGSMQEFVRILHSAAALAPYIVVDEQYQYKRNGMVTQLLHQGRRLACYETQEMIQTIQRRAASHQLNRGLHLHVPYFDDGCMQMKSIEIHAIPAGKVLFVPAFVVLACRKEKSRVMHDTLMSLPTRQFLLANLEMLETAFDRHDQELNQV